MLFNCDEACLERKDPTYRASVDAEGEQIDAETVKDVLNFVDATMDEGTEMAEVALEMKEGLAVEVGMEREVKQGDPVVQMVRELNRVGRGIHEQCKLITDLTYELESLDCGQYVLEELMGLYQYLYKNGQEHRGLPHLHKEHFMIDCQQSEENAIRAVFPDSVVYLCAFHQLQAWLQWLVNTKNGVSNYQT